MKYCVMVARHDDQQREKFCPDESAGGASRQEARGITSRSQAMHDLLKNPQGSLRCLVQVLPLATTYSTTTTTPGRRHGAEILIGACA